MPEYHPQQRMKSQGAYRLKPSKMEILNMPEAAESKLAQLYNLGKRDSKLDKTEGYFGDHQSSKCNKHKHTQRCHKMEEVDLAKVQSDAF